MPIDNSTQSRIENIRQMAGGGSGTSAQVPTGKVPTETPKRTPMQVSYPSITDDDLNGIFTESGAKEFKYLMNGMDSWSRNVLVNNPKYTQPKQYFTAAKQSAIQLADFYASNKDKWTEESIAKMQKMQKDYSAKYLLAQRSLVAFIDKDKGSKFVQSGFKANKEGKMEVDTDLLQKAGKDRSDTKIVWDPSEGKIVTRKYLDEKSEEVFRTSKFYSDIKTYKDDPWYVDALNFIGRAAPGSMPADSEEDMLVKQKIAENYGYTTFMKETNRRPPELEWKLNYMLKNWSMSSMTLMKDEHKTSFEGKRSNHNQHINDTMKFVYDVLNAGLQSNSGKVQQHAAALKQGLRKNDGSWKDKVDFVRNNPQYVQDIIDDPEFGYYSKVALFQKHKTSFNHSRFIQDDKLTQVQKGQRIDRIYGEVDQMLKTIESQKADFRQLKETYRKDLKAETPAQEFYKETMFNKAGDPLPYNTWINQFPKDGKKSDLYTPSVQRYYEMIDMFKRSGEYDNNLPGQVAMKKRALSQMSEKDKNALGAYHAVYFGDTHKRTDQLPGGKPMKENHKSSYDAYKNQYKQQFNDFNSKLNYRYGSMVAGFGAKGQYELEQREINLLKVNTEKARNATELINNVTKALKENSQAVYVKAGAWSHMDSVTDMQDEDNAVNFKKTMDAFFKDKESGNFNLRYINGYKDNGFVVYTFENTKTNKELSIAMPKSVARGWKEEFASAAYDDSDDFHFDAVGEKKLGNLTGDTKHIRNARIYYDRGSSQKVFDAEIDIWDEDAGKFLPQQRKIPLGDNSYITIDAATRHALDWIKQYEQSFKD